MAILPATSPVPTQKQHAVEGVAPTKPQNSLRQDSLTCLWVTRGLAVVLRGYRFLVMPMGFYPKPVPPVPTLAECQSKKDSRDPHQACSMAASQGEEL